MICKKCGATIPDGVKFCTECGAKIETEESTAAQNDALKNDQPQDQVQQNPQNMTGQFVQNNQAAPQGNFNQQSYGPQGGYNQPNYGPGPGYNNPPTPPYGPNGMNQGNYGYGAMPPKKKSSALPLILILVAAAVAAVLIVFFVMRGRNGGNPDPNSGNSGSGNIRSESISRNSGTANSSSGRTSASSGNVNSSSARASSSQARTSSSQSQEPTQNNTGNRYYTLPQGAKIVKNATLDDLEGKYKGDWNFLTYEADAGMWGEGSESEEFQKALEAFRSTSHDIELNYYYDGDWEFDVDDWMTLWADDFEADESEGIIRKGNNYIEELKDGSFSVVIDMSQKVEDDPDYGTGTMKAHVEHYGTLYDKDGKRMISGYFTETLDTPKGKAVFAGTFVAEKVED